MRIAPAHGRLATRQVVRIHVGQHGHLHIEQCHVDVLAFARSVAVRERREHGDGRIHAGHQVGDRDAGLLRAAARLAVALAGNAHEAANTLHDEIVTGALRIRPGLPEAGHRAVDQIGLHFFERRVIEAVFLQLPDLVVFQHHVALRGQFADDPLAFGRSDIDGDRALVAVCREVVGGFARVGAFRCFQVRRPPVAGVVADFGSFDLDDVGAEISERLRAPGPGEHACEIQHADMTESAHFFQCLLCSQSGAYVAADVWGQS